MRRFRWLEIFFLVFIIIMVNLSVLASSGSAMALYRRAATQNSIIHGVQGISKTSDVLISNLSGLAQKAAVEQYDALLAVCEETDDYTFDETEITGYYTKGYFNRIKETIGQNNDDICIYLNDCVRASSIENIVIVNNPATSIKEVYDDDGVIRDITIRDVEIEYTDPIIGKRTEKISFRIGIPTVRFYTENKNIFDYSLIAGKGIYATGGTSSIIGNIYAGAHAESENRPQEVMYGEIGAYGGLNVLSTQLGINSDVIVSGADININGSFVILDGMKDTIKCYGRQFNNFESFASTTMYSLNGDFYPIDYTDENAMDEYNEYVNRMDKAMCRLEKIPTYYDSDNDEGYEGPYRKIVASTDVELTDDFKGIVITPGNVIVGNGVNVEGLIMCGDRIYIRGNNSIVDSRGMLCRIVDYEMNTSDQQEASDYIGGMEKKGIIEPDYYVVPFR